MSDTDNPIFVLMMPDREVRIYANGVVEGVPESTTILNHIGSVIRPEYFKFCSKDAFKEPPDSTTEPEEKLKK